MRIDTDLGGAAVVLCVMPSSGLAVAGAEIAGLELLEDYGIQVGNNDEEAAPC